MVLLFCARGVVAWVEFVSWCQNGTEIQKLLESRERCGKKQGEVKRREHNQAIAIMKLKKAIEISKETRRRETYEEKKREVT